jgi:hypothetical protein
MHNEEFRKFVLDKHYQSDQIKECEMGRTCGIHRREFHKKFPWKNLKDREKYEDTDTGRIILK